MNPEFLLFRVLLRGCNYYNKFGFGIASGAISTGSTSRTSGGRDGHINIAEPGSDERARHRAQEPKLRPSPAPSPALFVPFNLVCVGIYGLRCLLWASVPFAPFETSCLLPCPNLFVLISGVSRF